MAQPQCSWILNDKEILRRMYKSFNDVEDLTKILHDEKLVLT